MTKKELNALIKEARSLIGSTIRVVEIDPSNDHNEVEYELIDYTVTGFGTIREVEAKPQDCDMFYASKAVLKRKDREEKYLDVFPLKLIVEAIQSDNKVVRDYYDQ